MDDIPPQINANTGRFLDQFRACIRAENKAYSTEKTYLFWCKRFILFHNKRHPKEMGSRQIEAFLNHLAINRHVSPSTQKTALNALIYMYRRFLKIDLPALNFKYAKVSQRIPVVFTHEEALSVIGQLSGEFRLMAALMYGSGLRISECCALRVKDIDLHMHIITIRNGKGYRDRATVLPESLEPKIELQINTVEAIHRQDLAQGFEIGRAHV